MKIHQMLQGVSGQVTGPDADVTGVAYRADKVKPGDAFFCIRGFAHDGHDFAADAVARGAAALIVETQLPRIQGTPQVLVDDAREALAFGAAAAYSWPSREMSLVGVTGTNGKTTTTYLIDSIFRAAGHTTGIIGTVETRIAGEVQQSDRTTPESADLQATLAAMRDVSVDAVAMEVSSHAIDLHRVDAVHFAVAAFTNLTQDHLDYHHTLEEYASVKRRLFTELDVDRRVINIADEFGAGMALDMENVVTVGSAEADVRAERVQLTAQGSMFVLETPSGSAAVRLPLAGEFNVSNALVAAACAWSAAIPLHCIVAGLEHAEQVPGRLERVDRSQSFAAYVDYAHTPDGLAKAIEAVRTVTAGRVIVVFGCGGDRDPDKRPLMGRVAGAAADHVVVTSDNPRSEDPVAIILQIEDGLRGGTASYEIEVDRRAAIACAVARAGEGDSVLVAGKGHEDYQIFSDRTIHFDDREVVAEEIDAAC